MLLTEFESLPADEAADLVRVWADVPAWVATLVAERPYGSVSALAARAAELAREWTEGDLDAALAQHPRIGDRPTGPGAEAGHSRREQASMSDAAAGMRESIAAGNAEYERRFGRVFLIRAAGRSPEEMLGELERRLGNPPEAEWREAAGQLAEIALLRLRAALHDAQLGAEPRPDAEPTEEP
ncbi:2-oxo-4-hydroxy-4-carboxy-5-ureidoimidazoline decarboxylase [Microbacterium marinilacus]|uniref:2-oxo-4-hydroxy-4-carboxy-5-ureidoimidazoline decarboxylase n=1 Tax=Microbacterium marinilacus TaxID=415209 RepID=A0ABP7BDX7_9MICO|nr:2-oxo-4-hydroxy-4-carboxy-5-ureidoimidazoline decarboxylase [Microbacterium marinilacus]MBY0688957.1 2-oxo-4-hydroxy-4-carboxy-5-ureidoimidazoline decarboxylase [Microbacterium marinilacus]